ncbi:MAG: FapA family protein [Planctomycetota bacterium]
MVGAPLTILGDVGLLSGSVRHDGNVRISGHVAAGYVVEATGDILVVGDLQGGQLVAGGDVTVRGIVSGPDALIDAIGRVRVRQAADTRILAGGDLHIETAAERCELAAGGRIRLTGAPGALRGGKARATTWIEAKRLECSGGQPAEVGVGGTPFDDSRDQIAMRLKFAEKQAGATTRSENETVAEYRRRITTLRAYRHLQKALERRLAQIEKADATRGVPCVTMHGDAPAEAVLRMADSPDTLHLRREDPVASFTAVVEDGEIVIRSLNQNRKETIRVG